MLQLNSGGLNQEFQYREWIERAEWPNFLGRYSHSLKATKRNARIKPKKQTNLSENLQLFHKRTAFTVKRHDRQIQQIQR